MENPHIRRLRTLHRARRLLHCSSRPAPGRSYQKTHPPYRGPYPPAACDRDRSPAEKRGHRKGERSFPSLPLPCIHNSQALGKFQNDPQLKEDKYLHSIGILPHGNIIHDPSPSQTQRSGCLTGSERCLPPCSHSPQLSGPPGIFGKRQDLPLSGHALRPETSPTGILSTSVGGSSIPEGTGAPPLLLPGRLAPRSRFRATPRSPGPNPGPDSAGTGLHYQLGQVGTISDSHPHFSGSRNRLTKPASPPQPRQDSENPQGSSSLAEDPQDLSQEVPPICGLPGQSGRCPTGLQAVHEAFSTPPATLLSSKQGSTIQPDPDSSGHQATVSQMDGLQFSQPGKAPAGTTAVYHCHHGCIPAGLGGPLSGQHGSREVVSQSCHTTYQCPGVSGSAAFITAVPPTLTGTHCIDTHRQCYSSGIHQQTGRNPLNEPQQFSGTVLEVVSPQGHHAGRILPPRTGQPDCRFPFPGTLFTFRVDAPPRGHVPHPENDGPSSSGLVCLGPQPPAPSILLPGTGPRSMGPGCVFYQLEGNPSLCLPSDSANSSRPTENKGGQSSSTPGGPLLAQETMVPGAIRSPSKSSDESPLTTGSSDSTSLRNPTSTTSLTSSNGLAAIGESARQSGLSDRAAEFVMQSHRDSTREVYNSRLAAFSEWCESRGVEIRTAPLGCVADFLISLFDKKRALSTIRGYRSAIAAVHSGFSDGSGISSSPYLSKLLRSFFLKRPPMTKLVPAWSLPRVLEALARPPFEPMATSSLHHLSMKTAFLIAIASGQRRSALHALCLTPGHIRWERRGVRLIPRAKYIAKNQTASSGPVEIFISPLSELSSIVEDKVWCPIRALKWYLDRTKNLRKDDQLFIITREPYTPASQDSISRWIVEAIQAAGTEALLPGATPRAHDTRGISASWALFQGVPLAEIQKAAYWRSSNSFISHYLRDIPAGEESFASAALTAAGSVA